MRVLIWGRLTPSSAFVSRVVLEVYERPIDSVWRFGRDLRHSTNGWKAVVLLVKSTLMNLDRTRISPKPGIKKARKYFTLVATNLSACEAFTIVLKLLTKVSSELRWDNAMDSHTHGRNRNLINLHVMLNGRRDCAL